jgi:nanoRNase/pAp phosphatase (c-di-AMP/oligoRNAs hydrolase)
MITSGGKKRFPDISVDMMDAVDKGESVQFNQEEVLNPAGWPLLNFIMNSRTGLGRYRGFRVPNYELMMSLIDYCRRYDIDDILQHPDVKERVDLFLEHQEPAKEQIKRCTTVHGNLAVIDCREEEQIYVANRFLIYALYPECNISMHVLLGRAEQNTVFAVGKSIFNRTSKTNIGELMLTYGGAGHRNAGTCQSDNALADIVRDALIQRINDDG